MPAASRRLQVVVIGMSRKKGLCIVAAPGREGNGRPGASATTAMWRAVLHGRSPTKEDAGQLPAGSALVVRPEVIRLV